MLVSPIIHAGRVALAGAIVTRDGTDECAVVNFLTILNHRANLAKGFPAKLGLSSVTPSKANIWNIRTACVCQGLVSHRPVLGPRWFALNKALPLTPDGT